MASHSEATFYYFPTGFAILSSRPSPKNNILYELQSNQLGWDRRGIEPASEHIFFYEKGNENHELGKVLFLYIRGSAVKRVEFVSDRMSCRHRWCDIVLNSHG
jgi:hypothetical protein